MTRILAFAAELARVDALESMIAECNRLGKTARETAVMIETQLSMPQDGFALRERIGVALLNTGWCHDARMQSLSSIIRQLGQDGHLYADGSEIIGRLADAVLTECRLPSVEMVDAGQAQIDAGAPNFMRVWLKSWERA